MWIRINDGYLEFSCGCKFKVTQEKPLKLDLNPHSDSNDKMAINSKIRVSEDSFIELGEIPLDCSRTWDMISDGNTKGVFQLETRLGQMSAKKLKPRSIEHLAALGAIMRPGCLEAKRDGKSVTDHYIDRKNGEEPVEYFHDSLIPILESTYGEMIYQEQAMQIAQVVAGFDLQQADILRKAIGKKKADIMAEVKRQFLAGCLEVGTLNEEEAETVFSWIEKSQRYSFNKSHSVSYAVNGYLSAYVKAHFKQSFFASWLFYAKDKQKPFDEIKLLINVAKAMDVDIRPPDFRNDNNYFQRIGKIIYFGFCNIKGIGESKMDKIKQAIFSAEQACGKERKDWGWRDFLIYFSQSIDSTSINGLIESGALDYMLTDRSLMSHEYSIYSELTKKEQAWFQQNITKFPPKMGLADIFAESLRIARKYAEAKPKDKKTMEKGPCSNKKRIAKVESLFQVLKNPTHSVEDTVPWIARVEEAKLGVPLTTCLVNGCKDAVLANCSCADFNDRKERSSGIFIAAQIDEVKTHIARNDKEMAFIEFSDETGSCSGVIFSDQWEEIKNSGVCVKENTVMISGERGREKESFIVKKMTQLS